MMQVKTGKLKNMMRLLALLAAVLLTVPGCGAGCGSKKMSGIENAPKTTSKGDNSASIGTFQKISVKSDVSFDYYLYTPATGENLPIVITFHGYGEDVGLPDTRILNTLSSAESQAVRPCYIIAPAIDDSIYLSRTSRDGLYDSLMRTADDLIASEKIDPGRIYAMGNSFGGLGTVEFAERFPDRTAAAIVMCPALTYDKRSTKELARIKDVPLWFAQATNDNVIPIETSRSAVRTLDALGASEVHLTEFTDNEMLAADALAGYHQADFAVMADERFLEWMFDQSR
ncbi:MAG: hypothetical protein E7307_07260 [Butyrivibrio sp.]|nr:hypothetical protein [Butyrivibrio sp.]